jgi:hypothetical protein
MFVVSSQLQFSGDLALLGIPDHPDAAGSWVLLPLFQLTGPGSMVFQVRHGQICTATQNFPWAGIFVAQSSVHLWLETAEGGVLFYSLCKGFFHSVFKGRVFRHEKHRRLAVAAVAGGTPVLTVSVLHLQGMQLQGYSQPMLQAMGSPSAAGRSSVIQLNSNAALAHLLTLPRCATGFLGSFSDS